jgi:MoaA/NifB/PqqE/SkfB family radical SAM enzyme
MKRKAAYLQITRECNNECIFCSNPQFKKEYSFEDVKNQVDKFKKENITEIILTGGEPTICPFIFKIISYINGLHLNLRIITNGVKLADRGFTETLYNSGLRDINISIHSCHEEIADKLSQKKGNYNLAIQGIKNALDVGFFVIINSTINSLNYGHLSQNASFFIKNFPKINHFVFNNLDPGRADGLLISRAGENPRIVSKLVDMELELNKTLNILKKNNKTFRVERVPLCYLGGFEEFSTETRKIVKDELYICSFIDKNKKDIIRRVDAEKRSKKVEACLSCSLNKICAGVQEEYLTLYGEKELYPLFKDEGPIINKILG